ncbi:hypothetical protein M8C21_018084, partial [Ambrosia artemisiifolia]
EFDAICRRLGLSGPDDFAISTADWEKRRAYSPTGGSFPSATSRFSSDNNNNNNSNNNNNNNSNNNNLVRDRDVTEGNLGNLSGSFESKVSFSDDEVKSDGEGLSLDEVWEKAARDKRDEDRIEVDDERDKAGERRHVESGNGIKGTRPPLLAPPPAAMSRVIVDDMGSNWDLIKSFAPREDGDGSGLDGAEDVNVETRGMMVSRVDAAVLASDEDRVSDERDDENVGRSEMMVLRTDTAVSPSGSDGLGDEDEGVSELSIEAQYSLSSNGSIRVGFKNWQKGDYLGSGSFGTVYEGFDEHGTFFAVKEVSLLDSGSQGKQSIFQLEQEISLLSQFHHENIVRYLGTDTDDGKLYIFLELVTKGSLARLYQKYELRDSQVSAYTRQILSGLNYLHERKVVHRDIKCANILVDASGSVKLADFGLA